MRVKMGPKMPRDYNCNCNCNCILPGVRCG